jgi:hypothetical protein
VDRDDWPVILLNLLFSQRKRSDKRDVEAVLDGHDFVLAHARRKASREERTNKELLLHPQGAILGYPAQ